MAVVAALTRSTLNDPPRNLRISDSNITDAWNKSLALTAVPAARAPLQPKPVVFTPYDTDEHAGLGPDMKIKLSKILGVKDMPDLNLREASTLADFVPLEKLPEFAKKNPEKFKKLLAAIDRDIANPGSVSRAEWEDLTDKNYSEVAKKLLHMSPNGQRLQKEYYAQALDLAAKNDPLASFYLAYSNHLVEDRFCGGHLFNARQFKAEFGRNYDQAKLKDANALGKLVTQVVSEAWPTNEIRNALSGYEVAGGSFDALLKRAVLGFKPLGNYNLGSEKNFRILLNGSIKHNQDILSGAVINLIHNKLNELGIPVRNGVGDTWVTYGDGFLRDHPEIKPYINKALEASYEQFQQARREGRAPKPDIEKFMPVPTAEGAKFIAEIEKSYVDPAPDNKILITALAEQIRNKDNISLMISELVSRGAISRVDQPKQTVAASTGSVSGGNAASSGNSGNQ